MTKQTKEIIELKDESLFNEKKLFEKTLISIGDAVISTDIQGKILLVNTITENLTGWKIEEARGRFFYEVFSIVNDRTRTRDHTILIAKDGSEKMIEDSAAPS